jgi:hypothetical protein
VPLRVLVGCEMSGRVRDEFAKRGWEAWSADLLPSENLGSHPGECDLYLNGGSARHYQGDVRDLFVKRHPVNYIHYLNHGRPFWHLMILHPPCDHLSYAGARWFKLKDSRRGGDGRMQTAAAFFGEMLDAPSPLVAVENPHSIAQEFFGPPTQSVQPCYFGDPRRKRIDLWLKGLPPLVADNIVEPTGRVTTGGGSWRTDKGKTISEEDSEGRKMRAIVRSRTSTGLARAMAAQWGKFAEEHYSGR